MKYRIYIVPAYEINDDLSEYGYDAIAESAVDFYEGDNFETLTKELVRLLNALEADQNFYFLCDAENGVVLSN